MCWVGAARHRAPHGWADGEIPAVAQRQNSMDARGILTSYVAQPMHGPARCDGVFLQMLFARDAARSHRHRRRAGMLHGDRIGGVYVAVIYGVAVDTVYEYESYLAS
jgi:hypothetical protein